jgi:hypothetical protein
VTLHLIKLSVGTEDVEDLRHWQARRLKQIGRVFHRTRMMPRRREQLLDGGGSIYWVIKGAIRARQRLTGVEPAVDEEGRPCALLLLDPELVRTAPRPHRAFQGWRYYPAEDAPLDLQDLPTGVGNMPPELVAVLHELGLL